MSNIFYGHAPLMSGLFLLNLDSSDTHIHNIEAKRYKHWCASVLNKRFKTPFCDGIWNRRQVSVDDRGVLPTRPRNRRG